jgi:hypothetical protein
LSSRRKVHLDASTPGSQGRTSACGFTFVDTEIDASKVTCCLCLDLMAPKAPQPQQPTLTRAGFRAVMVAALMAPKADPPPRLPAPVWASTCKGGLPRRCGACVLCQWEREVARWEHAAPDRHHQQSSARPEGAPRWSSLGAALIALAEWERHDRNAKSASAGILARIEFGAIDGGPAQTGDPLLDAAAEFVVVRRVLEAACPEGAHAVLTRAQCMALLLARTPGVEDITPSYDVLAQRFGTTIGDLRALVGSIRERVATDLAARGLIPAPKEKARRERGTICQARY